MLTGPYVSECDSIHAILPIDDESYRRRIFTVVLAAISALSWTMAPKPFFKPHASKHRPGKVHQMKLGRFNGVTGVCDRLLSVFKMKYGFLSPSCIAAKGIWKSGKRVWKYQRSRNQSFNGSWRY